MLIGLSINELRRNANAIARPHYRSLYDSIRTQFFRDFGEGALRVLVAFHRSMRNDFQFRHFGKVGDQFVRYAFAEVFLFGVAGEIMQGQHRQGTDHVASGGFARPQMSCRDKRNRYSGGSYWNKEEAMPPSTRSGGHGFG